MSKQPIDVKKRRSIIEKIMGKESKDIKEEKQVSILTKVYTLFDVNTTSIA